MTQAAQHQSRRIPGEEGVWVFIFGDMIIFTIFFLTFIVYRSENPTLYASQQGLLSTGLGLLNTLLLLTSSLFMAQAVRIARSNSHQLRALLAGVIVCGLGFIVVKAFEWGSKIQDGITLNTNDFFMFYYMFTGIHLMHVIIGLGIISWLFIRAKEPVDSIMLGLEGGGIFWHLVDLLWVVLFALLYLMK
jgi:nitric oxide reductase NorE protein